MDGTICNKRIVQIHPTLQCNLFCKHCYSNSGPALLENKLNVETLKDFITDASGAGYNVISFSGGEPLMYEGLEKLLIHSKSLGLRTSVTTNGTTLTVDKLEKLKGLVDLFAISLDGPPKLHNEIRNSANAFELLLKGLDAIKRSGIQFGFIHTLTRESWEHLLWIADFANRHGASLLQVHPLEMIGRADSLMQSSCVQDETNLRAYLLLVALALKYQKLMPIQYDVLNTDYVKQNPSSVYAEDFKSDNVKKSTLSELMNPLVVESDGYVVPVSFGFSKRYAICNITNQRFSTGQSNYLNDGKYDGFRKICKDVFRDIMNSKNLVLFNWYELITNKSHALSKLTADSYLT